MHYKTVREGQQALIVNHLGEGRVVIGPCRVFLYRERFQLLNTASATQLQYLVIRHQDGEVEHRPGPCRLYVNPLEHKKVTVSHSGCGKLGALSSFACGLHLQLSTLNNL